MNRNELEALIFEVISDTINKPQPKIRAVQLPMIQVSEHDRLDTGHTADRVYTHDVLSLSESPNLGAGIMEMRATEFDWTLQYDEIDYVISGELSVRSGANTATARSGEIIYIPKGSSIRFVVPDFARFLYVTYPADWKNSN